MDPLARKISNLENIVQQEIARLAEAFNDSYEKFLPCLKRERLNKANDLNKLAQEISQKLNDIETSLNEIDVTSAENELKALQKQLEGIREAREFVESVEEVERQLAKAYIVEEGILTRARTIRDILEAMRSAEKYAETFGVEQKICDSIGAEARSQHEYLCYMLSEYYRNAIEIVDTRAKHVLSLEFDLKSPLEAAEYFSAMAEVRLLDQRLHKLGEFIVEKMCSAIIRGGGGSNAVKVTIGNSSSEKKQIRVRLPPKSEKHESLDAKEIFGALLKLFDALAAELSPIFVQQQSLLIFLGKHIEKPLMQLVLKEVVSTCIPTLSRPDDPIVSEVMLVAEEFRDKMIEYGLFNDASPNFKTYADANDKVFIDRRCLQIITRARELILKPYIKLVRVGHGEEMSEELIDDFEKIGWNPEFNLRSMDESMPRLLGLLPCQVSDTTVEMMEMMEKTLRQAVESDSEMEANRLTLTARNIVQLFTVIALRHHQAAISSVPQQAAVFFNNCYFVAHRVIMLPFDIFRDQKSNKLDIYRSMFAENIPLLRSLAAKALENLLAQCRRNLSAELVDKNLFTSANPRGDPERDRRVASTLQRCVEQIIAVAATFREVMTETVYARSIANLSTFLLCEIGEIVLSMEDICQYDADRTAKEIQTVIDRLTPLFQFEDYNAMHKMCSQALYRIKEIAFCLQGSLQGIDDRWCDGKGPLANLLSATEVRHLVKALFSNTEQRKQLLVKIA